MNKNIFKIAKFIKILQKIEELDLALNSKQIISNCLKFLKNYFS